MPVPLPIVRLWASYRIVPRTAGDRPEASVASGMWREQQDAVFEVTSVEYCVLVERHDRTVQHKLSSAAIAGQQTVEEVARLGIAGGIELKDNHRPDACDEAPH